MEGEGEERQLNIHLDPENLAGVYANFANISFSDYEFTITFARIDHEVEEGDVPGVVVSRVNMSTALHARAARRDERLVVEVVVAGGDPQPAGDDRGRVELGSCTLACGRRHRARLAAHAFAIATRCASVGWLSSQTYDQPGGSGWTRS